MLVLSRKERECLVFYNERGEEIGRVGVCRIKSLQSVRLSVSGFDGISVLREELTERVLQGQNGGESTP